MTQGVDPKWISEPQALALRARNTFLSFTSLGSQGDFVTNYTAHCALSRRHIFFLTEHTFPSGFRPRHQCEGGCEGSQFKPIVVIPRPRTDLGMGMGHKATETGREVEFMKGTDECSWVKMGYLESL